jgi:hypothetical protein
MNPWPKLILDWRYRGGCVRLILPLLGSLLILWPATAMAAEQGIAIRAAELKAQPFADSATLDQIPANRPVTILSRRGAWAQVQSNGKSGWLHLLNLRLSAAASPQAGGNDMRAAAAVLRTGSSGKTVTTGVKGLDEESIRNASVNNAALAQLAAYAAPAEEAKAGAQQAGLTENMGLAYLKKRGR